MTARDLFAESLQAPVSARPGKDAMPSSTPAGTSRARARVSPVIIVNGDVPLGAVRCSNCAHAGDAGGDPWRAWCLVHRQMVSNTFPKLCADQETDELRAAARRRCDHLARTA